MFEWVNNVCVEEVDKGFTVNCNDRFQVQYIEGDKKITIHTQPGEADGRYCDIIYSNAFASWDNGPMIDQDKQKELLQNYKDAMDFQNMGVVVI